MALAGIIYLIIATICAAMFSVMFKIFHIKGVDSGQAIFFNYLTAFILGILFSLHGELVVNPFKAHWLVPVLILGLIFMAGMILLSDSTRRVGVAISTVCSRASMVIPIILAPIIVFITFGLSNSFLKVIQHNVTVADTKAGMTEQAINSELSLVTASVFFVAMLLCLYSFFKKGPDGKRIPITMKNIMGGIELGAINYFCTYMLMLSMKSIDSSILFPIHNIGIVAIGAFVGLWAFHEKMKPHQVLGIILAAVSIALLCI